MRNFHRNTPHFRCPARHIGFISTETAFTECPPDVFPQAILPSVVLKTIHYGCLGARLLELITKCSVIQSGITGFNFQKKKKNPPSSLIKSETKNRSCFRSYIWIERRYTYLLMIDLD